ncbi:cytochrome B561 [Actibacterium mucosum KCTC 23349]|uniref:Cytochrome B561 n=1 Tax=Actibacterium mucosum KCTC 23349 TaxID=1454373 RepID=A0A037ZG65_9RHOB|nr:cytochrome b561 domain-containing protein [Actibacterium mucosum]KAJ54613.1 cytochrome B561 [Actibacterium mucosum KCTC 23349]
MLEWLLSPVDPTRGHEVGVFLSWHARMMVVAWAFLVPTGILAARFFKIWPGQDWPRQLDNRNWWVIHRSVQYAAAVVMVVGLGLVLLAPPSDVVLPGPHALMGWTVLALAALQIAGGILRGSKGGPTEPAPDGSLRGDHFDMTPRRLAFEYIHKTMGYLAFLLSVATVLSGLWQANGPVWMWIVLCGWWVCLMLAFVLLQKRGRAIDTYQAIWGNDPDLPGNQRRPIGWMIQIPKD